MTPPAIRFCPSADGTRIAFSVSGHGTPLVRVPHWLTHLEYEFLSPVWQPWIAALASRYKLLRIDARGCGLSDRDAAEISFEATLGDIERVVDAAGFREPFVLLGHSQGAAVAIEYAARHPDQVSALVVLGGYARGIMHRGLDAEQRAEYEALLKLVQAGWGREDAAYRQMFATQFIPDATPEQIRSLTELQKLSCSAETATRLIRSFYGIDVTASAPNVQCPTLVFHARGDRRVPFDEGRLVASLIPGARLIPLETRNHILLGQEPAFADFYAVLDAFGETGPARRPEGVLPALTKREWQILDRVAQGLDNAQIAAQLGIADKTVRNNITQIFDKLMVENRPQAIVLARDLGLGRH